MIVECFRCGKELDSPDGFNSDYIIAEDTLANELREVLVAVKQNDITKAKAEEDVSDEDYTIVVVGSVAEARSDPDTIRVESRELMIEVQKTGIICPDDYKPSDFVIWGIHKKLEPK